MASTGTAAHQLTGTFGLSEGDRSGGAPGSAHTRRGPRFRARPTPRAPRHRARPVSAAPAAASATRSLLRSPTPPPAPPQQPPGDIGCSHALEDGPGARPAPAGRRAGPPPPARPPALALSRAQRPAGGTLGPAAHGSGCPICPQPTCPPLSHTHLTGCRLVAGGSGQRHGSSTAWDGSGGPRSACGASLLAPVGCLPRQQRFSCLFQPLLCRFPSL